MSQQRIIDYHLARIKDRKADIRLDALHQLILLKPEGWLEVVQMVFNEDTDSGVRENARKTLMGHYIEAMKSEQSEIRQEALRQYMHINSAEAARMAHTVLNHDSDKTVRYAARKLLIEYSLAQLKSPDISHRSEAIDTLEQLNAQEALDELQRVYKEDEDGEIRKMAQNAGRVIFKAVRARQPD